MLRNQPRRLAVREKGAPGAVEPAYRKIACAEEEHCILETREGPEGLKQYRTLLGGRQVPFLKQNSLFGDAECNVNSRPLSSDSCSTLYFLKNFRRHPTDLLQVLLCPVILRVTRGFRGSREEDGLAGGQNRLPKHFATYSPALKRHSLPTEDWTLHVVFRVDRKEFAERLPAIPVLPLATVGGLPASQTLIEEKVTYTTKPIVAEQIIEVPQVEYRDHLVEERQTVFVEKVIHVPRTEIQERIVEVPRHVTREVVVDVPQVQVVEKFVEVPTPIYQEKIIPVARPVIKQKITHVPNPVIHEKFVEVPRVYYKPVTVEKIVEVPDYRIEYKYRDVPVPQKVFRFVPVDRIRHVPQIRYVDKIVKKPEIRTHSVSVFETTQERPVKIASPRRVPISNPATPVLVEREQREVAYCDSLMEGLFGCFMPATPVEKQAFRGVSRRRMRLLSPRSPPINVDVAVMSGSPRHRRRRRVLGDCCSSDVAEVSINASTSALAFANSGRWARCPISSTSIPRTASAAEERRMQLLELEEQQRQVRLQVHKQQTEYEAQQQLFAREQEHLRKEVLAGDVMIQTRYGPMKFQEFEKLNNEDLMKSPRGLQISTCNTVAYSPSLATPRTQAGETDYRTPTSVTYVGGPVSVPPKVPVYQEAPVILSPRVVMPNRGPVYLQEHQPMYFPRTVQCTHHGDGSVGGVYPAVRELQDEDILDERYTIQLQQLTKIAFRNAYQADSLRATTFVLQTHGQNYFGADVFFILAQEFWANAFKL
ncbi:UNVERIFIED_CONTAM: alveolin domain containing intermediate filament IMC14 [Hammondia hammondi]|eukprot:XP_008882989.1 alveolin domain containing intermediate filament IMC14 [Hammondia hammondi]